MALQVKEAFETLDSLNWLSSPIQVISLDGTLGHRVVFTKRRYISHLIAYSHLTLIDATHKINQLEWKLYTLIVRDSFASWLLIVYTLVLNEFRELITEFLLIIKK